jgi:hypothetical protein
MDVGGLGRWLTIFDLRWMSMTTHSSLCWAILCWTGCASFAAAEEAVVVLKNGGQVRGDVLRAPSADQPASSSFYIVRLSSGSRVKLAARQVRKLIEPSTAESKYERLLPKMPDSAAGHLSMAQWCQENGLKDLRLYHLQQVLRHESDHEEARRSLGYGRIEGRWIKADDWMRQQGYVRYQGAWRVPQQVAIMERQREIELAQKNWRRDLKMWRGWLGGRRDAEAREKLRQLKDPLAVPGLAELLAKERDPDVRETYVDLLARFSNSTAVSALVRTAIQDPDMEIRLRAIDHLRNNGRPQAVRALVPVLSHKDNGMVNRAAAALGRLGDAEAVLPLIDALVTRHETVIQPTSNIRPSFGGSRDGTGGFNGLSVGGGPRRVVRNLKNKSALAALVTLTKQNFQYSHADWKRWYIREHSSPGADLRRDP